MIKIPNFENSRWRTAAILKIVLSLYLGRKSSDFNEIWDAEEPRMIGLAYLTEETFDDILAVWTQQLYTPLGKNSHFSANISRKTVRDWTTAVMER